MNVRNFKHMLVMYNGIKLVDGDFLLLVAKIIYIVASCLW